jgi:short-subunit dehydrogenase
MPALFAEKYGPWAVVAGASEGLGAAFAAAIAARGVNLVLLARRGEVLAGVAGDLRARFGVEVRAEACDLGRADLADTLAELTAGLEIGLGIYNAAFAPTGDVHTRAVSDLGRVVDVNVRGPLVFARTLAPAMVERGRGGLVLMSSLAGFQGAPNIAAYAASKAFNIVLAESLWSELSPHGVDVVGCAAGAVRTPGYAAAASGADAPGTLDAAQVAEAALAGLGHGPLVVPGTVNRIARFVLGRLLPRRAAIAIMAQSTRSLS